MGICLRMWLLQIPEKGNTGAVWHLPGWCSNTKEPQTARPGLKLAWLVAPALPAAGKSQLRQPNSQLPTFVIELGDLVLQGTLHTGLSPDLPRHKAFLELMFLQNNVIFPCPLCFLMWRYIIKIRHTKDTSYKSILTAKITYENKVTLKSPVYLIFLTVVHFFFVYLTAP